MVGLDDFSARPFLQPGFGSPTSCAARHPVARRPAFLKVIASFRLRFDSDQRETSVTRVGTR
jgi:hypothetical protein